MNIGEVEELKGEISELRERVIRVEGELDLFVNKLFIAFNVSLLVAVIEMMLKMIFVP